MTDVALWVTPILSLLGALLGGVIVARVNGQVAEHRAERALVRDARIALERWWANQNGPRDVNYPGMDPEFMAEVSRSAAREFFATYFLENSKARAALGAVRHLDNRIGPILDESPDWRLPADRVGELRSALREAEFRAWSSMPAIFRRRPK